MTVADTFKRLCRERQAQPLRRELRRLFAARHDKSNPLAYIMAPVQLYSIIKQLRNLQ